MAILVAEPDSDMQDVLQYVPRRDGQEALLAPNGVRAPALWQAQQPNLVLLGTRLPGLDGWEVCQRIRSEGMTPIIFLTIDDDTSAVIRGLDLGADDYITKPFDPWQLLARIRAVLRRSYTPHDASRAENRLLSIGDLTLDSQSQTVQRNVEPVKLTRSEFMLLMELIRHEHQVLTAQTLSKRLGDSAELNDRRSIERAVEKLRRKIEPDPTKPTHVLTVVGCGYTYCQPSH